MTPRAIVLSIATAAYAVFIARTAFTVDGRLYFTLFDDAMISMQYARNLADGHGLRWNPGEPAVEGFSNLLWTLVMALIHRLGADDAWIALLPMLAGALTLLATAWLAADIGDALSGEPESRAGLVAAVLTASCYPLVFWTLRGMEVGLVALFTMLLLRAFVGGPRAASITAIGATIALTLTRDDGLVPVVAIVGAALVAGGGATRRMALLVVATLVAVKTAHLGWRFAYYGDLVPNTYYLKLTGVSALARAWAGALAWASVVVRQVGPLLVPALVAVAWRGDARPVIVIAPFAAAAAYSITAGGDAWEYFNFANRYVSAALPPLCVLAGMAIGNAARLDRSGAHTILAGIGAVMVAGGVWDLVEKGMLPYVTWPRYVWGIGIIALGAVLATAPLRRRLPAGALTATGCVAVCLLAGNARPYAAWAAGNAHAMPNDRAVTALGVAIRETTTPEASLAAYFAGSAPYFARRRSIDLFGKSDPHVARMDTTSLHPGHNKVDLPYSLGLQPDVVVTLTDAPPETRLQLEAHGYVRLCAALWAREESTRVNRSTLAQRCVRDPNVPNDPND